MEVQKQKLCFCFNDSKPESLIILKTLQQMPQLILSEPQQTLYVWVGEQEINVDRDKVQQQLKTKFWRQKTLSSLENNLQQKRLKLMLIVICGSQLYPKAKRLRKYQVIKQIIYFGKISSETNVSQNQTDAGECEISIQSSEELLKKLQSYKGFTSSYKVLPNFLFLEEDIAESHLLVRTMWAMISQPVDQIVNNQIVNKLQMLFQKVKSINYSLRKEKYSYRKFLDSLSNKNNADEAISQYTQQTLIYKILNNLLRSHRHPSEIYYIQPYFKKLFQAIQQMFREQFVRNIKFSQTLICYRGGMMTKQEFQRFRESKGRLIQNLGFFSTSLSLDIAKQFSKGAIFQIQINRSEVNIEDYGFANIQSKSNYIVEKEILFNPLNIFEVVNATLEKEVYKIELKYRSLQNLRQRHINSGEIDKKWETIALLQKQERDRNLCQGNALLNQYYKLEGSYQYWAKYLEIVNKTIKKNKKVFYQKKFWLQKAYALFHIAFHKMSQEEYIPGEQKQFYNILVGLFGQSGEFIENIKETLRDYLSKENFKTIFNEKRGEYSHLKLYPGQLKQIKKTFQYKFFKGVENYNKKININKNKQLITKTINLRNMKVLVQDFQALVKQGVDIQELSLFNSRITTLPNEISGLKALRKLNISKNSIRSIPSSISQLKQLISLQASDNVIKTIPQQISNLSKLLALNLSSNYIQYLPQNIGNLSNLIKMDLSFNKIQRLPQSFGKMVSLQELNLGKNLLNEIHTQICNLQALRQLSIFLNMINKVPIEISNLLKLDAIDLRQNQLQKVSLQIMPKILKKINLSSNQIKSIDFENLEGFQQLKSINLSKNRIRQIPENIRFLKNIMILNVSSNQLVSLPVGLSELVNLEILNLQKNLLSALQPWFASLINLQVLNLGDNKIRTIPKQFKNLRKLKMLSIQDCPLTEQSLQNCIQTSIGLLVVSRNQYMEVAQKATANIQFQLSNKTLENYSYEKEQTF